MTEIRQGRWTANVESDFVVYIIGARLRGPRPLRLLRDLAE